MLLQVKDAEFRYADVTVFEQVNIDINEGDSIGLVGANGCGKSTLLKCIVGEYDLFCGSIYRKNGLTLGYLKQNADFDSQRTLYDELMSVFDYQTGLINKLKQVSDEMSKIAPDSDEYARLADKYHRLTLEADASDAYNCEVKVRTVINGMGMQDFADRIVSTLSGGEKTKGALCKLLLLRPELMILDEPTNHLDYKTLDWLENFLADKKSALLVVSHDRYFLDKLCTKMWDMQARKVTVYNGNYSKYKILKQQYNDALQSAYDKQQKERAHMQEYVDKNKVRASTANMAKSREKALERMEIIDAPVKDERPPYFNFTYTSEPSEFPLTLHNFSAGYGERTLVQNAELTVKRGSKVALLGLNGTGKSTVLRHIANFEQNDYGKIIFGKNVRLGYYDQENLNLDATLRVLDQLWFDNTRMSQTEVRSLLAEVSLGQDDVFKLVGELSGGERAKLGLAMIMAKDVNLLLLDEPTNHLDLPSREALEQALTRYSGTVLFVSHDRYFVNSIADTIAELDNKTLNIYQGNYDDFASRKYAVQEVVVPKEQPKTSSYRSAKERAEQTNRLRKIKQLEARLTEIEMEIDNLNNELTNPSVACDYVKVQEITNNINCLTAEYEQVMAEWESLQS